eukprot:12908640-Prorocentrum_lima.AAC.1
MTVGDGRGGEQIVRRVRTKDPSRSWCCRRYLPPSSSSSSSPSKAAAALPPSAPFASPLEPRPSDWPVM